MANEEKVVEILESVVSRMDNLDGLSSTKQLNIGHIDSWVMNINQAIGLLKTINQLPNPKGSIETEAESW